MYSDSSFFNVFGFRGPKIKSIQIRRDIDISQLICKPKENVSISINKASCWLSIESVSVCRDGPYWNWGTDYLEMSVCTEVLDDYKVYTVQWLMSWGQKECNLNVISYNRCVQPSHWSCITNFYTSNQYHTKTCKEVHSVLNNCKTIAFMFNGDIYNGSIFCVIDTWISAP